MKLVNTMSSGYIPWSVGIGASCAQPSTGLNANTTLALRDMIKRGAKLDWRNDYQRY